MTETMENSDKQNSTLKACSLKVFIPALNFERSKAFYRDIGFETKWEYDGLAHIEVSGMGFLLQNFYVKEFAENLVMHLLVASADDWWCTINQVTKFKGYDISLSSPEDRPWGLRDFSFKDPSGVLWRVANEIRN